MAKPIVAIVGRPNVGKSTLFNRLIGERRAIVEDEPGTTRDRVYGTTDWGGVEFTLVDTGGLQDDQEVETESFTQIAQHTREQAHVAIGEADVIVFMVDARTGINAGDHEVADMLRRADKPTILVANKADSSARRDSVVEFYELGLGDPIAISSYHGSGTGDLLDRVVEALPEVEHEEEPEGPAIAIVGRPNVGKSRLLNALLGQERSIVSDVPGTTRDSLDTVFVWAGQPITLIDTAGIRRRGRVDRGIEQYSVLRSMRAIDRADVVLLVIDATEGFTSQDLHIAGYIAEQKKGVVVVVNKWDLIEKDSSTMEDYREQARAALDFMPYAPLVFVSAKFGQRVQQVMDTALTVVSERHRRVSTAALNKMLKDAVAAHPPPAKPGKWLKFFYATQADVSPPTFVFFMNDPAQIHFSYRRYLENKLRETFGFTGTAIRMASAGGTKVANVPGPLAGVALVAASFLIGAVPWGYLLGKASSGIDLRTVGSGGTGATNVLRTLGPRASVVVALLDTLKGVFPVLLARSAGFNSTWVAAAAVATVAGHCWSPFIGFKGGKGVATGAGAATALFPYVVVIVPVMALVVWVTRYVSLGSLIAAGLGALLAMAYAAAGKLDWAYAVAIVVIGAIIVVRHEGNIRRLLQGRERRIGETVAP